MVDLGGEGRGCESLDPPDLSLISPKGVVLGLFISCFALLVSWLFGSLKYSCYLCWQEEKSMVCDNFKPTLFLDKALNY